MFLIRMNEEKILFHRNITFIFRKISLSKRQYLYTNAVYIPDFIMRKKPFKKSYVWDLSVFKN